VGGGGRRWRGRGGRLTSVSSSKFFKKKRALGRRLSVTAMLPALNRSSASAGILVLLVIVLYLIKSFNSDPDPAFISTKAGLQALFSDKDDSLLIILS
jgi:hypothetical protein